MGVARLLAKGWVVFCLFAGAHAFDFALRRGATLLDAGTRIGICVLLFGAMGLLFIGGFGVSSAGSGRAILARLKPRHLMPSFDALVFIAFVAASFAVQVYFIPAVGSGAVAQAMQKAMYFVVPGLPVFVTRLSACAVGNDYAYSMSLASAFSWLLAIIFVASAVSRIAMTAGLLRLEHMLRPSAFGLTFLAVLYGAIAIVGIQLLYVGSVYPWLDCSVFTNIPCALLIGLMPLLLAYLIVAALATLKASGPPG